MHVGILAVLYANSWSELFCQVQSIKRVMRSLSHDQSHGNQLAQLCDALQLCVKQGQDDGRPGWQDLSTAWLRNFTML